MIKNSYYTIMRTENPILAFMKKVMCPMQTCDLTGGRGKPGKSLQLSDFQVFKEYVEHGRGGHLTPSSGLIGIHKHVHTHFLKNLLYRAVKMAQ